MERIPQSEYNQYNYCYICYSNPITIKHNSCNGRFCESCILNWTLTSIKARNLDGQDPVPCLQNSCQDGVCYTEFQKIMSKDNLRQINECYNENYYTKSADITRCPKEGCEYAGFIKLEACTDKIQWRKCEYEWKDHAHQTTWEKVKLSLKNTFRFSPESFNYLNKVMWSNPCPQCGMFIEKLDGCAHMVWQYCKYEFWWICLGHYPGYVHKGGEICGIRKVISIGFALMAFTMMFIYSMYVNNFVCQIIWFFSKSIFKFLFCNAACLSILFNLVFSMIYAEKVRNGYYYNCWEKFSMLLSGFLVVVWPMIWSYSMYLSYYSEGYSFIIMWPIYEVCALIGFFLVVLALILSYIILYHVVYQPAKYLIGKVKFSCRSVKGRLVNMCKRQDKKQGKKNNRKVKKH